MTTEELRALQKEIHRAAIVEGKAANWDSTAYWEKGDIRRVILEVQDVGEGHANEFMEIMEKYGFVKAAHLGADLLPKTSLSAYWTEPQP